MTTVPRCPYCGGTARRRLQTRDWNRRITDDPFTYYRCETDGLIFLHPAPEDLGQYYPAAYYNLPDDPGPAYESARAVEGYKAGMLNAHATGKRLLEIGPGQGAFAYFAKEAGYAVSVIEMDSAVCRYMQDRLGIAAVNTADVVNGLDGLGEFDAIAMWHVLEHMPDAWDALRALSEHIAPGGILIIAVPNPNALQFRVFGKWWTHLDAPRHVYQIPADLLIKIGAELGLECIEKTDTDPGSLMWNRLGWQWSLRNLVRHRLQMQTVARWVERLARPVERRSFRGATYTLVFKKARS
jgi:2-polyprenyl-3-methyl-5-hydroxy-6-metoxy-1,4-benzoquinol methylase